MNSSKGKAGFTLVELLVAMLVTVMLIGSATAILRSVAGARAVVENRQQGEQEAMLALRTITTTLRNAYRPVTDSDVLFEGILEQSEPQPASRVRFRAVDRRIIRPGQPESDVHEIEFFVRETGGQTQLMQRTDPTRNLPPDGGGVVEPLASDVVGLDMQYFDGQKWLDRWPESQGRWPTAVNVRLIYRADTSSARLGSVSRLVNFPYWAQAAASPDGGNRP